MRYAYNTMLLQQIHTLYTVCNAILNLYCNNFRSSALFKPFLDAAHLALWLDEPEDVGEGGYPCL